MKCSPETLLLYAVTDRAWTGKQTLYQQVEQALKGGVTCVQLREKELDEAAFLVQAKEIGALCRAYGVPFIVNDSVEIALACGADGVHVGQSDRSAGQVRALAGGRLMIGVSARTVEEALRAQRAGADYLGVGAVFSTSTKPDAKAVSRQTLKEICAAVDIPVTAIGGISRDNISELSGTGIDGVALVSAIFAAEDIEGSCRELRELARRISAKPCVANKVGAVKGARQ